MKPSQLENTKPHNQAEPHHGQAPKTDQTADQADQNAAKGTPQKTEPQKRHHGPEEALEEDIAETGDVTATKKAEPQRSRPSQEACTQEDQAEADYVHPEAEPQRCRPSQEAHIQEDQAEAEVPQPKAEPQSSRPSQEACIPEDQAKAEYETANQQTEPQCCKPSQETYQQEDQVEVGDAHPRAEPQCRRPSQEAYQPEDLAEQRSSSPDKHTSIIQPLAIIRAVTRCVEFLPNNIIVPTLTSTKPGTAADIPERAEPYMMENLPVSQAEQSQAEPRTRPPDEGEVPAMDQAEQHRAEPETRPTDQKDEPTQDQAEQPDILHPNHTAPHYTEGAHQVC